MLITIEGIDGTGKSTLVKRLGEEFRNALLTKEPQDKDFIFEYSFEPMGELFAFMLDHVNHLQWLKTVVDNNMVICDRYIDSRCAYQSVRLNIDYVDIFNMHFDTIYPDHTYLLTIDIGTVMQRLENRDGKYFFTNNPLGTQKEHRMEYRMYYNQLYDIQDTYYDIAADYESGYTVLDVTKLSEDDVFNYVKKDLLNRFPQLL